MSDAYFKTEQKFSFSGVHTVKDFMDYYSIDMITADSRVYAALLNKMFFENGFEIDSENSAKHSTKSLLLKGGNKSISIENVHVSPIYENGETTLGKGTALFLSVDGTASVSLVRDRKISDHYVELENLKGDLYTILVKKFLPRTSYTEF